MKLFLRNSDQCSCTQVSFSIDRGSELGRGVESITDRFLPQSSPWTPLALFRLFNSSFLKPRHDKTASSIALSVFRAVLYAEPAFLVFYALSLFALMKAAFVTPAHFVDLATSIQLVTNVDFLNKLMNSCNF